MLKWSPEKKAQRNYVISEETHSAAQQEPHCCFLQPRSASQWFVLPSAQMLLYSGALQCQWRLRKYINQEVLRTSLKAHTKFQAHSSNAIFGFETKHFNTTSRIAWPRTITAFCNAYTFAHQSVIEKQKHRTFNKNNSRQTRKIDHR